MEYFPSGFVVMINNFNLKIVEMILYRFSPFEPLNVRARPLAVSLVNLFTSFPKPGKALVVNSKSAVRIRTCGIFMCLIVIIFILDVNV